MQLKLVIHHVGARDGGIPFPMLPAFARDMLTILYEADVDAIGQIRALWSDRGSETRVLPYCLFDRTGDAKFNINFDAYTSSLLPFDNKYSDYYMYYVPNRVDYVLGEACRPMRQRRVAVVTLDELMQRPEFTDAQPDFLSLDTQGSEHAILTGAERTLRRVLAVCCEAEFVPIYRGQRLFCDLVGMLTSAGFQLMRCDLHEGFAPLRAPIGARAGGQPFAADLVFLRDIDSIQNIVSNIEEHWLALHKLAFISVCFRLLEHALHILEVGSRLDFHEPKREISYCTFLKRLTKAVAAMPPRRPPTVAAAATFEEMQARFQRHAAGPTGN